MTSEEMLKNLEMMIRYNLSETREKANRYTDPKDFQLGYLLGKCIAYGNLLMNIQEMREYTPA